MSENAITGEPLYRLEKVDEDNPAPILAPGIGLPLPPALQGRRYPVMTGDILIGYVEHVAVGLYYAISPDGKRNYTQLKESDFDAAYKYSLFGYWVRVGDAGAYSREEAEQLLHELFEYRTRQEKEACAVVHFRRAEVEYEKAAKQWAWAKQHGNEYDRARAQVDLDQTWQFLQDCAAEVNDPSRFN